MGLLCGCSSKSADPGANRLLFNYLGNPVPPPAALDAAYTNEGLTRGLQSAAQAAGVSLVKLVIDGREYPSLVGVVCASQEDRQKLEEQISKDARYNYTGGWGGNTMRVMNLVPLDGCPPETRKLIMHRLALREQMLGEKMSETN